MALTHIPSVLPVAEQFKKLEQQEEALHNLEHNGKFWDAQRELRENLQIFITQEDFSKLTGEQVVRLAQMVNTHRPFEPFRFLMRCAALADKNKV